jgi:hypothetical protein
LRPIRDGEESIRIDLDTDRIKEIVDLSYDFVQDFLGVELNKTKEQIMSDLQRVLDSHRVTTQFTLDFSSVKMDDFQLRVDPRRREVLGITKRFKKKKNQINAFLRNL